MLLIGQFISPFVRRVGVTLEAYGLPFAHRPWSVFGDAERILPYHPGLRVPVLVLDDGAALTDSLLILEYLDTLVPLAQRMGPTEAPLRVASLALRGLANGLAEKSVALVYHQRMHGSEADDWQARCLRQMAGALARLEASLSTTTAHGPHLVDGRLTHADIAVATAFRFAADSHGKALDLARYPFLRAHSEAMESLPAFRACIHPHMVPHIQGSAAPEMR